MKLFSAFVEESNQSSWLKINNNRHAMLKLCIKSHISFELEDFAKLYDDYNGSYWMGADPTRWYTLAIESGNKSAILAWEKNFKTEPFLLMGKRLAPDLEIIWNGHANKISSLNSERIVAIGVDTSGKNRQYTITHSDLNARSRAIKSFIKEKTAEWNEKLNTVFAHEQAEIEKITNKSVKASVAQVIKDYSSGVDFTVVYDNQRGFKLKEKSGSSHAEDALTARVEGWFQARAERSVDKLAAEITSHRVAETLEKSSPSSMSF